MAIDLSVKQYDQAVLDDMQQAFAESLRQRLSEVSYLRSFVLSQQPDRSGNVGDWVWRIEVREGRFAWTLELTPELIADMVGDPALYVVESIRTQMRERTQ